MSRAVTIYPEVGEERPHLATTTRLEEDVAVGKHMGNKVGKDMGNTFSAPGRLGARVCSRGRTSAHLVANPAFRAFKGLRRGVQKFLFNIRDSLGTTQKCNPCVCPPPVHSLSSPTGGEGWGEEAHFARCPSPGPSPRSFLAGE